MKKVILRSPIGLLVAIISLGQSSAEFRTRGRVPQNSSVSSSRSGAQAPSSNPASGSQQTAAPESAKPAIQIPPGSIMYVALTKSIDVKKAKPGDEVAARFSQPVLSQGKVIIPNGAKAIAHVTKITLRTKDQKQSELGIAFDRVVLKDGTEAPLSVTLQAVNSPENRAAEALQRQMEMSQVAVPAPHPISGLGGMGHSVGTAANTASSAGGGQADATGVGTVGLPSLNLSVSNSAQGAIITSDKQNVRLDSGTELVLRANP